MEFMSADLTISLPGPLAADVRAAAEARGLSPEEYVRLQLAADLAFSDYGMLLGEDLDVAEDEAIAADFDKHGIGVPGEEVIAWIESIGADNELPRPRPRKLK
jgi:predicted transcriptional regulator